MTGNHSPMVTAQMMIRKPAATVFQAFVDPSVTTHFWFTKSSGRLEEGQTVTWEWEMYGFSTIVFVKEIRENERITIEWSQPVTTVELNFIPLGDDKTYVVIKNYGFDLSGDQLISAIIDNTGGFTTVLDGMKAYLEHHIKLKLIEDKFPKEASNHGKQSH